MTDWLISTACIFNDCIENNKNSRRTFKSEGALHDVVFPRFRPNQPVSLQWAARETPCTTNAPKWNRRRSCRARAPSAYRWGSPTCGKIPEFTRRGFHICTFLHENKEPRITAIDAAIDELTAVCVYLPASGCFLVFSHPALIGRCFRKAKTIHWSSGGEKKILFFCAFCLIKKIKKCF